MNPTDWFQKNMAKKIKVVPNWLKCQENWSEISFRFLDNPLPPDTIWEEENVDTKFKLVSNWPKWLENWSEIIFKIVEPPSPPSPNWELKKMVKWKNKSCFKLEEITRKMVRNYFWIQWGNKKTVLSKLRVAVV